LVSMRNVLPAVLTSAALVAAVAFHPASSVFAETAAAPPASGLTDPCDTKGDNWRGKPFFEILFMNKVAGGAGGIGNYYNSLGNSFELSDEEVDARFRSLNDSPMLPTMATNEDGSLTIHIQKDSPGKDKEANWLPAPNGPIYMVMRLYWPKTENPSILPPEKGTWAPPAVEKAG
jgi:hypothetical protein